MNGAAVHPDVHPGAEKPELESLSAEELQWLLEERDAAIVELSHEIEMLRGAPDLFKQRLARLEDGVLQHVHKGCMLEVDAPLLEGISRVIREDHLLEHQEEVENHKAHRDGEDYVDSHYLEADDLVLGRHYMALDQKYLEEESLRKELKEHPHPIISEFHYGGHVSVSAMPVPAPHPGPPEEAAHGPPRGPPGHDGDGFWLEEHVAYQHGSGSGKLEEHPPERFAFAHDLPGEAEDALPIDWLGRAKRGLPHHKPSLQKPAFAAPSWLY